MTDTDFYIDKPAERSSTPAKDPMPLEGKWWKYGLAFASLQIFFWILLGFKMNPEFSLLFAFQAGQFVYGMFIFLAFLPFGLARLGYRRMMWFTLMGVLLGLASYYLLALFEPTRRFNLLPFISYLQLSFAGISLGLLWEFGLWTWNKLKE